jgi:O-antigen/teichoic acid export membrane protein
MPSGTGLRPRELQSRALRGVTWSSLSSLATLPLSIVVSVVLARTLGPEGLARFALLTFLVPLLHTVTDLGYGQATTRLASQRFSTGDLEGTRDLIGKAVGWNLLRLPAVIALTLAVAHPALPSAIVLVAALVWIYLTSGLSVSINAENRGAAMAKVAFVQGVIVAAVSIAAALAGASATTIWALSFAASAAAVPGWALAANPSLRRAALTPRLPRRLPVAFWRFAVTALAVSLGYLFVFSRSEVVILDILEQQHALAVFALAYGLSQRLTTPVDTLLGPLIPALAALDAAHPDKLAAGFERSLRLSVVAASFICGGALVGTMLTAPILYGAEYEGIGTAFAALALVSLLRAAAQPYTALAYASGRPGIVLRSLAVAMGVDVALAFGLIPALGLWGAVIANAAGGVTALSLIARGAAGTGSVRRAGLPLLRLGVVTALACLLAYGAGIATGEIHAAVGALTAFAVGAAAFCALVRVSGGLLPRPDVQVLLDGLPRRVGRAARVATVLVRA